MSLIWIVFHRLSPWEEEGVFVLVGVGAFCVLPCVLVAHWPSNRLLSGKASQPLIHTCPCEYQSSISPARLNHYSDVYQSAADLFVYTCASAWVIHYYFICANYAKSTEKPHLYVSQATSHLSLIKLFIFSSQRTWLGDIYGCNGTEYYIAGSH